MRTNKMKPVVVGAPDLVMDLPVSSLSSSPRENVSSSSPSPSSSPRALSTSSQPYSNNNLDIRSAADTSSGSPSPDMTAAECFAKQNQSTLKKTPVPKTTTCVMSSSTDAQTQTLLHPGKPSIAVMKSNSLDVSQLCELKITENEDIIKSDQRTIPSSIHQQRSVDERSSGGFVDPSYRQSPDTTPLVEVRSATPSQPITPNTPRLTARYLQAVAASSAGGSPVTGVTHKPQVRVKPTVKKKPSSVSPADSDSEQHHK